MRHVSLRILLAVGILGLAGTAIAARNAADETPSVGTLLEQGRNALAQGRVDEAISKLTLARDASPDDPAIYNALAAAYAQQGVEPMVVTQLEKSLAIDSTQAAPQLQLAEIHLRNRRFAEAAGLYRRVLQIDPANDTAGLMLGQLYLKAKQPVPATSALAGYVQRHPEDDVIVSGYLDALAATGQHAALANAATRILQTRPDWLPAILAAARGHAATGNAEQALAYYMQAEALQRLGAADALSVGRCHLAQKNDDAAAGWFERALAGAADPDMDWGEPAAAFMRLHRWDTAARCYERRLAQDSTSAASWLNYALCKQQLQEYDASRRGLRHALALQPDDLRVHFNLANTYVLMDSTRAARRAYTNVVRLAAGQENAYRDELLQSYRYLSVGELLEKDWEQALPNLDRVLRLDPSDIQMRLYRAQALMALNRKAEARQDFQTVLNRQPDNPQAKKGLDLLAQYN